MMIKCMYDEGSNKKRHFVSELTDDDFRRNAVVEVNYYIEQMFQKLLECLQGHVGLGKVCEKYVTERGYDWSYVEMYETSFMNLDVDSIMEMGTNLYEMGEELENNDCSEDERKVDGGFIDDVGFYLVEVGLGLQSIGTLWKDYKDVIEKDKRACFSCLRFDW